jgi:type II secretory ATPase GspE/PulE/Tfp pilus assembly ATPase PilB-like protein
MRAFLRADPDIIMVGEIRDKPKPASASRPRSPATWCSPRCTPTAPRIGHALLDMGMDPFNFADALLGILAQRLAKRRRRPDQALPPRGL